MPCCVNELNEYVSVVPSKIHLELVKDADTEFEFTLLDGYGNPVDLTVDSVILTVRNYRGGTVKLKKTNAPGSHENPTDGKTRFLISNSDIADTLTDAQTIWIYEIRRVDAALREYVHIAGEFVVRVV